MQTGRTTAFVLFFICILGYPEAGFYLYLLAIHYFMLSLNNALFIKKIFLTLYVSVIYVQLLSVSVVTDMDGYPLRGNAITFHTQVRVSEWHW